MKSPPLPWQQGLAPPRDAPPFALPCRHCGAPLADQGQDGFCCAGCAAAFDLINRAGLNAFYDRLTQDANQRPLRPDHRDNRDTALSVKTKDSGECSLSLFVDGLHCAACVWLIESLLAQQPDLLSARVNFTTRRLRLVWSGSPSRAEALVALIENLGFRLIPFDPAKIKTVTQDGDRELLRCLAVAGFAAGNVMLLSVAVWAGHASFMGLATRDFLHWVSALIAAPAILYAGRPFYRSALAAVAHGRTNMDVPITIGVLLTTAMSLTETIRHGPFVYFDSAITLLFFLLIGRVLDHRARGATREAATHLLALQIVGASRLGPGGAVERVPATALKINDQLLVAAGERIAADGEILTGTSDIDRSLMTGETMPASAGPGTALFAGTLNLSAPLTLRVTATGDETLLAEIVRLMESAATQASGYRALADRLSGYYAPFVHLTALFCFLVIVTLTGLPWQTALLRAIAVLIITCPCALGLAIPAVQVVVSGWLLKRGILLKSPLALEKLEKIDLIAFDKTGTLTIGQPQWQFDPTIDPALLALAAGMARTSRHPLSRALADASPLAVVATDVEEIPGRGLRSGNTRLGSRAWLGLPDDPTACTDLWLSLPDGRLQQFHFADQLRQDAPQVIARLKQSGYDVALLSGDRPAPVATTAATCGILDWQAGLDPVGKAAQLDSWRRQGHHVLMVGDGLNDGPALAAADVSLSPSSAADLAQNAADVIFQGDALAPVATVLSAARAAGRVIRQNLVFAILYNIAAIPLAVTGLATPPIAALLMSSSSLIVVLNALRLRRTGKGPG